MYALGISAHEPEQIPIAKHISANPPVLAPPLDPHNEFDIISMRPTDPDHPFSFSQKKKTFVVLTTIISVMNSTTGSSLTANITPYIADDWNIENTSLLILPTSIYLVGYIIGPLVCGPLSESYGRKWVMVWAFMLYTAFTLGVALAPNFAGLVIMRLLCGIGAACAITVTGGVCADLYEGPEARGRAMAVFMGVTTFGPTFGPIVSGFISPVMGWRWTFWVGLIFAGVSAIPLFLIPETYVPKILQLKARALRKSTGNERIRAPLELEKQTVNHIVTVVLTRPVRMFCGEAIIFFSCIFLAFAYAIFYMFFQSFPLIYVGVYNFSLGQEGLAFLPIGVGALIACGIYLGWDAVMRRATASDAPWARKEEIRRLPLACFAGPFVVLGCFWLGWTARPSIHWAVPIMAGIPFGIGFLLLFMSLLNYVVDSYKTFAASAMAASGACRAIFGTVLPFAARPMYEKLGIAWACSLLGFLALGMAVIPFVFIWKGEALRGRSKFCQYLIRMEMEEKEKNRLENERAERCSA